MLDEAHHRDATDLAAIEEAAITTVSALDRMDQRQTDRQTLLFELRSERGRCRELDDLLIRMLDREGEDRITSLRVALAEVDDVEMAVRSSESVLATHQASPPPPQPLHVEQRNRRFAWLGCSGLLLVLATLLIYKVASEEAQRRHPAAGEAIEGSIVELMSPETEAGRHRMAADWATRGIASSSSFGPMDRALGPPDIYLDPELDSGVVWSPRSDDAGTEFLELAWNMDLTTRTIVVVEGPNAGAVVAVDEIRGVDQNTLGAAEYVRLWSGRMEPSRGPRFAIIHLPAARALRGVRLVLDTSIVAGPNSIDAVGLVRE